MAHPFRRRLPISDEAVSLCWHLRSDSAVSTGDANVGELSVLENSVGGVEDRVWRELEEMLGDACACSRGNKVLEVVVREVGFSSQLAQ